MKKSVMSTAAAVVLGLLMSGCGGNTPDDVAVAYVNSLAKGDIEVAKGLASGNKLEMLSGLTRVCAQSESEALYNEFMQVMENIVARRRQHGYKVHNYQAEEIIIAHKDQLYALSEVLALNPNALFSTSSITVEEKKQKIDEKVKELMPMAESIMNLDEIKYMSITYPDAVKKLLILSLAGAQNLFTFKSEIIPDVAIEFGIAKITPECIADKSGIGTVDEINVMETKEGASADQATVRLEIINANGESKKQEFDIEKIKDEWKVK